MSLKQLAHDHGKVFTNYEDLRQENFNGRFYNYIMTPPPTPTPPQKKKNKGKRNKQSEVLKVFFFFF